MDKRSVVVAYIDYKKNPKGKNTNLCISGNYRGITLSSIFGKVFDRIILSRFSDKLCVSDLQFGSRPKDQQICVPCF
jgi:hypothetical protein